MFEKRLKELNPTLPTISYDVADLYAYLDTFADFTALVCVTCDVLAVSCTRGGTARLHPPAVIVP